ncbi:MAG: DNA polymerase I, partial [Bacteroidota bacterium]|nr:DNA polymerase I [Bacteroidota bacterium]
MDKRLFLLDAMALIFRAYYALIRAPRITSKGKNTNAQFGFTNTLVELINNQKPTHMAVCFEGDRPSDRVIDFADYKANRQEAPEDLTAAMPDIKKIIAGFNIPMMEYDGFEADDVIGTLSKQAEKLGYEVFMVTPDKDYGQLVSEKVKIYKPGYQGGDVEIMGPKEVCNKWCIKDVSQVIDMLGLMGDAVDNIPGIAGIGQKTACKLIAEYGSIESILAAADNIKGSLGEKLRAGKNAAIMSKKLATIICNVPVEFHEEDFRLKEWNTDNLKDVFNDLEFKTIGARILGLPQAPSDGGRTAVAQGSLFGDTANNSTILQSDANAIDSLSKEESRGAVATIQSTPHEYELVESEEEFNKLIEALTKQDQISFDTETTNIDANIAQLVGMSFSIEPGSGWYVPLPTHNSDETKSIIARFSFLFNDEKKTWIGHNIKYDLLMLKWYDVTIKGKLFDTMLAHYVIEPDGKSNMDWLSLKYLNYEPIHIEELLGKKGKGQGSMQDVALDKIKEYAVEDADITLQFKTIFEPEMKKLEVEKVFHNVDNPLVPVLVDMEFEGVKIDMDFLKEYSKVLDIEARAHEEKVYEMAGVRFNLSSPKQLGEVLFDKLKIDPNARKT